MEFSYQSFSNKVYFGESYLSKLPEILEEMGGKRLFVILRNTPETKAVVQPLLEVLGESQIILFHEIVQHVPKTVIEKALKISGQKQCDLIIAIGGGSAIGLAKAMALETGLP